MWLALEVKYAYIIWDGKLERKNIVRYDPKTERFEGQDGNRHFLGSFDSAMYFKTPEEAIRDHWDGYREGVHTARQEVQDALIAYKTIRKLARMTLKEFTELVPKDF